MPVILASYFNFPPNTNNAYGFSTMGKTGKARSYVKQAGLDFKQSVWVKIKEYDPDFVIPKRTPLKVTYRFYVSKSYINKFDIDGSVKLLQDAIFKCGGGNDAWIYQMLVTKHDKGDENREMPDWSHVELEVV